VTQKLFVCLSFTPIILYTYLKSSCCHKTCSFYSVYLTHNQPDRKHMSKQQTGNLIKHIVPEKLDCPNNMLILHNKRNNENIFFIISTSNSPTFNTSTTVHGFHELSDHYLVIRCKRPLV